MLGLEHGEELVFYPEYEIPIGSHMGVVPSTIDELRDGTIGCYRRAFSNGIVLVNPSERLLYTGHLGRTYQMVSAWGGGGVHPGGGYVGGLSYKTVSEAELHPHTAAILLYKVPATIHSVSLELDKDSFSSDEMLTLYWEIDASSSGRAMADAYLAVLTPQGSLYFYQMREFIKTPRPVASSMAVVSSSGSLGPFPLSGLQQGLYTWFGVLVRPGADPLKSYNWVSNLESIDFSVVAIR